MGSSAPLGRGGKPDNAASPKPGALLLFLGVLTVDPLGAPDLPGLIAAAGALLGLGLMVPNAVLLLTLTLGLSASRIDLAGPWIPGVLYPRWRWGPPWA